MYEKPSTYTTASLNSHAKSDDTDTPFLSNFTRRLSALSSNKKVDYDSKNDLVKEHDTNGSSLYGRSYLSK